MLNNLAWWHLLAIFVVLVIIALVVVAIFVVAVRLSRKYVRRPETSSLDPAEQIRKLAQLRDEGLLSETEYEAKRTELLGRI